eukprot:GDKH01000466.1.p3 GENE.GDKH01000466.1~~GDKH01000466.1.p3  ORF type:complete len:52 (-),score=5.58 GDKH01000466.1:458-613(-)
MPRGTSMADILSAFAREAYSEQTAQLQHHHNAHWHSQPRQSGNRAQGGNRR